MTNKFIVTVAASAISLLALSGCDKADDSATTTDDAATTDDDTSNDDSSSDDDNSGN